MLIIYIAIAEGVTGHYPSQDKERNTPKSQSCCQVYSERFSALCRVSYDLIITANKFLVIVSTVHRVVSVHINRQVLSKVTKTVDTDLRSGH